jgi:hypothetical protein
MVANIRCTEIMEEQLRSLAEDQAWASLRQESEAGSVANFGDRAEALLDSCITGAAGAPRSSVQADWESFIVRLCIAAPYFSKDCMRIAAVPVLKARPRPVWQAQRESHRAERGIVKDCLKITRASAGYEQEARYFEEGVRHAKQVELAERAEQLLHGAYVQQLAHLCNSTLRHLNAVMLDRDPNETFAASAAR